MSSSQVQLLAIARTLRDVVAPQLSPGAGRLAVMSCVRMLQRLAQPRPAAADSPALPLDDLPPPLRQALVGAVPRRLAEYEVPAENSAIDVGNAALMDAATAWIAGATAQDHVAITRLVDWEGGLQDAAEALHEKLEVPQPVHEDSGHVLDPQAVEAYFKARCGNHVRMTAFNQLMGGTSKQTALVSLEGAADLPADLVIRRDQIAETMSGSVVQEFPLLQIVYDAGVAIPRPLFLEPSAAALGRPFSASERLSGKSTASHFFVPENGEAAFGLAEQMARLHAIPVQKFAAVFGDAEGELTQNDSPECRRESLEKMREAWHRFVRTPSLTMTAAFRWMENNLDCADGPLTLVHGDMGFHNMLVDGKRFVALLDWETAHIDHPAGDLGYARPMIERMVPWQDFVARYREAGGQPVTARQVHFFGIWEILRINIQLRHVRELYESGATEDIRLGEVGTYYVPRFVHRISQHLRRALHETS